MMLVWHSSQRGGLGLPSPSRGQCEEGGSRFFTSGHDLSGHLTCSEAAGSLRRMCASREPGASCGCCSASRVGDTSRSGRARRRGGRACGTTPWYHPTPETIMLRCARLSIRRTALLSRSASALVWIICHGGRSLCDPPE